MKRVYCLIAFIAITIKGLAQIQEFDTNGPIGAVLFDQQEDGSIVYSDIIESVYNADTIFGLAMECIHAQEMQGTKVSNLYRGITKITCTVEIPVGNKKRSIGEGWSIAVVEFDKAASFVRFNLTIDVRDNKYRYTLKDFTTDRWRISGKAVEKGPSNLLHWQRMNSLKKELERERKEDERKIIEAKIEEEEEAYNQEYESVMRLITDIKNLSQIEQF